MKREELTPIDLECNMGPDVNGVVQREPWKAYDIDEVNLLLDDKDAEIAALKAEIESLKASHYAEMVDAGMRERRLNRALWLARAYRAEARKNYWYARSCHEGDKYLWSIDGSAVKYIGCIKRTNFDWLKVWSEVESKCIAKSEEYR